MAHAGRASAGAGGGGGARGKWQLSPELRAGYELFSSSTVWDVLNKDEEDRAVEEADEAAAAEKKKKKKAAPTPQKQLLSQSQSQSQPQQQEQPQPSLSPPLQHRTRAAQAPDEKSSSDEDASDEEGVSEDGAGGGRTGDKLDIAVARAGAMRLQHMWEALCPEAQQRYAQLATQSAPYRTVLAEQRLHQKSIEAAVRSAEVNFCTACIVTRPACAHRPCRSFARLLSGAVPPSAEAQNATVAQCCMRGGQTDMCVVPSPSR